MVHLIILFPPPPKLLAQIKPCIYFEEGEVSGNNLIPRHIILGFVYFGLSDDAEKSDDDASSDDAG